jgi:hypothetical protein
MALSGGMLSDSKEDLNEAQMAILELECAISHLNPSCYNYRFNSI